MGVIGTFCQHCGVAVQHDHYVPSAGSNLLKIYRGSAEQGGHNWESGETPMQFGPEHAWLKSAVGVPYVAGEPLWRGAVEDGSFTTPDGDDAFVAEGANEDLLVLHQRCWKLLGEPASAEAVVPTRGLHAHALLEHYQQQLFDFRGLRDDGKGWLLHDPDGPTPEAKASRARLEHLLEASRKRAQTAGPSLATVADVLSADDFRGFLSGEGERRAIIRYRRDVTPELDRAGYPMLVWLMRELQPGGGRNVGPHMNALDAFEVALKSAVEQGGAAVLVAVLMSKQAQYVIYARDEAATRATLDALSAQHDASLAVDYDNERDEHWAIYFEQVWPARRRG